MKENLELGAAVVACTIAACVLWFFDGKTVEVDGLVVARNDLNQALPQYHRFKREGVPLMACVNAGRVAVAYGKLSDWANHAQWLKREDADCARVQLGARD